MDNNFAAGTVLTDLSKAFDCIQHDLLFAKLSAYNFSDEALYTYLTNRRQCVRINNTHTHTHTHTHTYTHTHTHTHTHTQSSL